MLIFVRLQNCVNCAVDDCFSVQDLQIISVNFCTMHNQNLQNTSICPEYICLFIGLFNNLHRRSVIPPPGHVRLTGILRGQSHPPADCERTASLQRE